MAKSGSNGLIASIGGTAIVKVAVMGISGILGLLTGHMIIASFGTHAYVQYGLLGNIPSLLPFADLGIATVVINAVAGADNVRTDEYVRRTIVTAIRILCVSGGIMIAVSVIFFVFGLWQPILGNGLMPDGGSLAAFLCLALWGVALPLVVGQRILVGMRRNTTQVAAQAIVAPFIFVVVGALVLLGVHAGAYVAVITYVAMGVVSAICLVLAARLIAPQLGAAIRQVPFRKKYPGVSALNLAWPMLVQVIALPIAMQSDRILLSHLTRGPQLAQYNLAAQLFGLVLQTIAAAGLALWPIYAKARSRGEVVSPAKPTLWFTLGGLAVAVVLALISPLLSDFISSGKIQLGFWLIAGFVIFVTLEAAKYPVGMYMTDKRGLRFQVIPILILVPLNLALSWWLIGVIGAGGPIIGSAIAVGLCQVIPNLWYVKRDVARKRRELAESGAAPGTTPADVADEPESADEELADAEVAALRSEPFEEQR